MVCVCASRIAGNVRPISVYTSVSDSSVIGRASPGTNVGRFAWAFQLGSESLRNESVMIPAPESANTAMLASP